MDGFFDDEKIGVPCECGHEVEETIGRLKTNPTLICPKCGARNHIEADELKRGLAEVEKKLAKLFS